MNETVRKIDPYFYTAGGVVVSLLILISISMYLCCWLEALYSLSGSINGSQAFAPLSQEECRRQLKTIAARLSQGEAQANAFRYPEGNFFCHSFYGFNLINLTLLQPQDQEFRKQAIEELERLIPQVDAMKSQPPFDYCSKLVPTGGVIYAGHCNLLRAGYATIGGTKPELIESFHERSAALYDAFAASHDGFIASYPGFMIWPVDNCSALESLRLHDRLFHSNYSQACRRAASWLAEHLDKESGMLVAQINEKGEVKDGPRGCALAWSLALLPNFAPDLAREQYARFRTFWFVPVLGTMGIREYPPGHEGQQAAGGEANKTITDTGAVVWGIGAAASGLGIAAARANGDHSALLGLTRGLTALAFPCTSLSGERYYFARSFLLADELALWGLTLSKWDGTPVAESTTAEDGAQAPAPLALGNYNIVLMLATIITFSLGGTLAFLTFRAILGFKNNPEKWSAAAVIVLIIQVCLLLAWLFVPGFSLMTALALAIVTDLVERAIVRARVIKKWP